MSAIPPGAPANPNSNQPIDWGAGQMPPGQPLPASDPWVKALMAMSPNTPLPEAEMYASRLRDNMFQALQDEIKRDNDRHEKEKQIEKEMNQDDG